MNTPKPPAAPDPVATANAQGAMNKETATAQAQLNMVDQFGPGGSSSYTQTGNYADGTPKFRQDVSLSPAQQALYDSQNQISQEALNLGQGAIGRVANTINQPFGDTSNAERIKSVEAALMSRLSPQIEQDRRRLETRLANQGVTQGTDAYNRAIGLNEQNVNDARMQAVLSAGQEDARLFSQDAYKRGLPFNELASLMGFAPGVQIPGFQNSGQTGIAPPDYQSAVAQKYQGDMNAWQANNAANQSTMGSIFGLAGSALPLLMMSDRRAKTDIRRIGTADNGLPIYSYRYKAGGPVQIGFMSDDVKKVKPWAVANRNGFDMVDYSLAVA